jgi:hypothetical protein
MLCYGFPWPRVPASSVNVSLWLESLLHLVVQITSCIFSHTAEQDSQPTSSLISKQVVPYRTRGGTYWSGVSTPKIRSSADSSMTNYITWWNPTVFTIPSDVQTTTSIITTLTSHHDAWKTKTLNNDTRQTQHHKYGKTYTPLMSAWLSITNQIWPQILKIWGLGNSIKACMPVCILERENIYDQYGQGSLVFLSR